MSIAPPTLQVAVLLPCYNEELTIEATVAGFRRALPDAEIYVYDNNSRDQTRKRAQAAGAIVRGEPRQGKGNVVRRMFADVEADLYLLADGDATYDPDTAPRMIELLTASNLDMVIGRRVHEDQAAYRHGHVLGNRMMTGFLGMLFGAQFSDIFSGYRVFSRRFVKSFPVLSSGFEIETELSVHALHLSLPTAEVDTRYGARPAGSASKLSTYRDGFRILSVMLQLFKNERPLAFFSLCAMLLSAGSIALATPLFLEYARTGLVPRFPTAILCASVMVLAFLSVVAGVILDTVSRGRRELKRLSYLAIPAPGVRQNAASATGVIGIQRVRP
jgi:glycosyltransferase involved in cell wall biosynthesis